MSEPAFSIVLANLNGVEYLQRGLGSLLLAAKTTRLPHECIVVNDAGEDDSQDLIRENFPEVILLENRRNRGYAATLERGIRHAKAPVVVLASNDLVVRPDFISTLIAPFADDDRRLFAVSARTADWDLGEPNHLQMLGEFRGGLIEQVTQNPKRVTSLQPSAPIPLSCFMRSTIASMASDSTTISSFSTRK